MVTNKFFFFKAHVYKIILLLALCFPQGVRSSVPTHAKKSFDILIIQSYDETLTTYCKFDKLLHEKLQKGHITSNIRTFYLDCERYNAHDEEARMYSYLDTLSFKPDIIIVNDDQATYTLMACNHPLGKSTPVVFSGVNFPNWELLKHHPNFTGYWDKPEYLKTLKLVEKLYGSSKILIFRTNVFIGNRAFEVLQEDLK